MLRIFATIIGILLILAFLGVGGVLFVFQHFGEDLPDYRQLADYEPPVMTRVHAGDGHLLAEYAIEKRVFVPISAMPNLVIKAFLAAEDKNFFKHHGVDALSVVRAVVVNLRNIGSGRRPVGASTITQQVAKNFLLTNEVSWERKIKEAILAFRMERAFSKDRILELYLNEIYLGFGSYGVAAAALNYFDKPLDALTISEAALLAALPKAPSNYNPFKHPAAALTRRNWVIRRMGIERFIDQAEVVSAQADFLTLMKRAETEIVHADYFAEEVRRELAARYGEEQLYQGGLSVRTTLAPRLQAIADKVLRKGLEDYDRRHGWRGPLARLGDALEPVNAAKARKIQFQNIPSGEALGWLNQLAEMPPPPGLGEWSMAVVLGLDKTGADIGFADAPMGRIPLKELKWARAWKEDQLRGPSVRSPADVLAKGDVIAVEKVTADGKGKAYPDGYYGLRQVPEIEGGLVALDPHTGRILAMSGGYSFKKSEFNRATQAMRQPGSAFKPFVYLAALDQGYTPSTIILDAPFVIDQGPGLPKWRPGNYTKRFYGPSTMRLGLEKSRNLMTVRLAQTIGMEKVANYARRFGIVERLPKILSMSLGAGETTLLRLTTAYAMLVNGGKRITPTLIDRIQDRNGRAVLKHDKRPCHECLIDSWVPHPVPEVPDDRQPVTDPGSAYQVVSLLQGVVERGTGRRIKAVGKPLAGKTGTTNNSVDAWFIGFAPDLALGVFVGFDAPRSLGKGETGSTAAAPIFRDFMAEALKEQPEIPFRIPPNIRLVRVNAQSGRPAKPGERNVIREAFKPGTVPTGREEVLRGVSSDGTAPATGTGGLY
jgi:penicillin-binding protein 1A